MANLNRSILIAVLLFLFVAFPFSSMVDVADAATYGSVFGLNDYPGGPVTRTLTVSITSSLYYYYASQNHNLVASSDFAKFITPYAVKPIADALLSIYSDDELFADGVLSLVQQVPYQISPEVYPVETLKLNYGDCGSLSLLAASIMKAGGLDVILLEYPSKQHLNIGVNLPNNLAQARSNPYYVNYHGERYYVAETTGDNFPDGWRAGEFPPELGDMSPNIVAIEGYPQTAPAQVSASYKSLSSSQVSISVSSMFTLENSAVNIAGTVYASGAEKVSIYVSSLNGVWQDLATVNVDSSGHYVYQWTPEIGGIYYLQASWSGDTDHAGADSQTLTLYVIPLYGLIAAGLGLTLMILLMSLWFINRRSHVPQANGQEPETPSEPSDQKEQ